MKTRAKVGLVLAAVAAGFLAARTAHSQRDSAPTVVAPAVAARLDGTTLLVVELRREELRILSCTPKPFPCAESPTGDHRFEVRDETTGALVAEGGFALPQICPCDREGDAHASGGCVPLRHVGIIRLKVPHRAARERVHLRSPEGRELARAAVQDEARP